MNFQSLSDNLTSQLTDFMTQSLSQTQSSRQPRLGPDAVSPTLAELLVRAVCSRARELPAGLHWSLHPHFIPCLVTFELRSRSSQAVLCYARLLIPLRVSQPIRLLDLLHLLEFLHNPPRPVGFRLALLHLDLIMIRLRLSRRPVRVKVSRQFVTPLPHGWLTSFTRSALILALSSMRRLCDAVLRPGSASLRLRPLRNASECILMWLRYRRRWLLGWRLWLAVPSHCRVSSLRLRHGG